MGTTEAAERGLPLLWCGAVEDPSGYADELRSYLVALEHEGVESALQVLTWTTLKAGIPARHERAIARARARRPAPEGVIVYHVVPGPKLTLSPSGPTVLRTMFETDGLPASWLATFAEVDEVWVPCGHNLETFARAGVPRAKLQHLPETIDFELFAPVEHGRGRPFTFLTSFDFTDRKGWDILLDAWAEAFSPDDGVRLVLKCMSIHGIETSEIEERLSRYLGARRTAPIELNLGVMPSTLLPRLYASADAFVLASRGEGWGRPYMEAMAMGLPTIGSRWSGNLDFMHDGNSWLVDGSVVPVSASAQRHTTLYRGQSWFEPDRDALAAALREVAAGGAELGARAAGARAELIERFGPAPTAARIVELTEGALERWRARRARPFACAWRGDWGSVHSLAVVNEALSGALEASGAVDVARRRVDGNPVLDTRIGIAQQWPPVFEPPSDGPFVLYQPWEFGEIPADWVEPIRTRVDEVWTPSEYSRQAFLAAGLAPELVHVVPNGVDLDAFSPVGEAYPLPTAKGTVFLFVGGTTYRKGIDLLLQAYGASFAAHDDVCLVVKSFGAETVYRGQSAEALVAEFAARPDAPELLLLSEDVAFAQIPSLYRAADCVVQPYRGEGFCLPALEALACGVPLIVTAGGPSDEFSSPACAWQVPSRRIPLPPEALPGSYAPAGGGFLLEPELGALGVALRAAADPGARAQKAGSARAHAERFSWPAAAAVAAARLAALAASRPIRTVGPAVLAERRALLLAVDADWSSPETWAPAVRAFAQAFAHDDEVTLLLPAGPAGTEELVERELVASGSAADDIADLVLADRAESDPNSIALAADAYVCSGAQRPARARAVVAADPSALRTLLTTR